MWGRRRFTAVSLGLAAGAPGVALRGQDQPGWKVTDRLETALSAFTISATGQLAAASAERVYFSEDGFQWKTAGTPGTAVSMVYAGDDLWMVTEAGLHVTADGGKNWRLAHKAEGLTMVAFAGAQHGYATGARKTVLETVDGGATWAPLEAASAPETNAETTAYHWVDFVTPRVGVITGASRPPRKGLTGPLPAWRDPNGKERRAETPSASITLETRDGGKAWKHSSTSLFGRITRVRYSRDGRGLALVEFHDRFAYPCEVFSIDLRTGASERALRRKDRAVTDLVLFAGPRAVLAGVEPPSDAARSTLGTVRMLHSADLKEWTEQPVDKEIAAGRVWLAGWSADELWAATDTGAVLHWKA